MDKVARWGDLESDEEEESEEEEEEAEEGADEALADGLASVASGYSSLPSGIETPEVLDLRKAKAIGGGAPQASLLIDDIHQLRRLLRGLLLAFSTRAKEGQARARRGHCICC